MLNEPRQHSPEAAALKEAAKAYIKAHGKKCDVIVSVSAFDAENNPTDDFCMLGPGNVNEHLKFLRSEFEHRKNKR